MREINQSSEIASTRDSQEKMVEPDWAWARYQPDTQRPWNLALAGHLYRRAAFGANWAELQLALNLGPQQTIDKFFQPQADAIAFNHTYDKYDAAAAGGDSAESLRAWWLRRILQTPSPLLEKMTLFWHSHFAVDNTAVKSGNLMLHYMKILRRNALGSFRDMLTDLVRNAAMLMSLGAGANRKALPNENFARPLFDTFTLGPGHATQKDVQEAARAFTGLFVFKDRLSDIPREHDNSIKHILGQTGNFTHDDVVRIVLEQNATAHHIIGKLYRWLISETAEPTREIIEPLARTFARDYNINHIVETMLRSNLFFSPAAYRRRIKCPLDFAMNLIRGLEGMVPTIQLGQDLAALGQNLYHLPTVNGWTGGTHWIDTAAVTGRFNLAAALVGKEKPYAKKLDPWEVAAQHGHNTTKSAAQFMVNLFLQDDLDASVRDTLWEKLDSADAADPGETIRRFVHRIATLPEFQSA
ncbi:MAG: DUF1800 domain-containing protein [Sedimentisphaerales bacterium]|nr:DUF1800 domain-containing protein [Sedimentisphaerales bacterium]